MPDVPQTRMAPDARRELIETAAARLFAERGYGGTTLDETPPPPIVPKPMVYRHFESKKALYLALLQRHRDDMPRFFEPGDMRAVLEGWFAYVEERPHGWKMLFRDTTGDAEIQAYRLAVQVTARGV